MRERGRERETDRERRRSSRQSTLLARQQRVRERERERERFSRLPFLLRMTEDEKVWLPYYKPLANAKLRLVAFHWAGGSASAYNGTAWRDLPEGVELLAVQLPGREQRNKEETPKTAQKAAELAVKGLSKFFDNRGGNGTDHVPTVIFAHSMGTWVAFEFIRELRRKNLVLPKLLIVSNLAAPQTSEAARPWRRNASLTESQFKEECRAWGVNEIVMKDTFWKNYHLPFRRDFTIFDEYKYKDEDPLDVAIVTFLSEKDPKITKELMSGWADQSKFKVEENHVGFPGDHFYVQDRKLVPKLVSKVAEYLTKVMGELISFFSDQTNAKKRKKS